MHKKQPHYKETARNIEPTYIYTSTSSYVTIDTHSVSLNWHRIRECIVQIAEYDVLNCNSMFYLPPPTPLAGHQGNHSRYRGNMIIANPTIPQDDVQPGSGTPVSQTSQVIRKTYPMHPQNSASLLYLPTPECGGL